MFQISTLCHKNAKAATVPLGHTQVNGASGAHTHHSPECHQLQTQTLSQAGLSGKQAVCFPTHPHSNTQNITPQRHFSGRSVARWLVSIFGVSLPDPQFILLLNNLAFPHLQNGCNKSISYHYVRLKGDSEQKVLIPIERIVNA